jgi:multiple sugar transport system ATP-binding protein
LLSAAGTATARPAGQNARPVVAVRGAAKLFSNGTLALQNVDLDIGRHQFMSLLGPSGCGKSTLLRMIAGLEEISGGELRIDGKRVNEVPPAKREIAMVFQSYALYPHMTVYKNLSFGLETAGFKRLEIEERVMRAARMLQIVDYLQRKPKALSGGQRQRVAIGRAIVRQPKLFLFDEPLSNLDAELRVQMRVELSKLHADLGATMIYVTHDQVEAMTMADRIVVLRTGRIEQVGTPLELYNWPSNQFVAGFIGSPKMNFIAATVVRDAGGVAFNFADAGAVKFGNSPLIVENGQKITLGIRPEHVELGVDGLPMVVNLTEQLGGNTVLYGTLGKDQPMVVQIVGQAQVKRGDKVHVIFPPAHCHAFDEQGGRMLLQK